MLLVACCDSQTKFVEGTEMNEGKCSAYAANTDQMFMFSIKHDSVTRARVTILAKNLEIALVRIHALFPGSDLTELEAHPVDRH